MKFVFKSHTKNIVCVYSFVIITEKRKSHFYKQMGITFCKIDFWEKWYSQFLWDDKRIKKGHKSKFVNKKNDAIFLTLNDGNFSSKCLIIVVNYDSWIISLKNFQHNSFFFSMKNLLIPAIYIWVSQVNKFSRRKEVLLGTIN